MQYTPTIKKVPAEAVPFGPEISTRGNFVWAAFDDERFVCAAATAREARALYRRIRDHKTYGRAAPQYLNSHRDRPQPITAEDIKKMGLEGEGRVKS